MCARGRVGHSYRSSFTGAGLQATSGGAPLYSVAEEETWSGGVPG